MALQLVEQISTLTTEYLFWVITSPDNLVGNTCEVAFVEGSETPSAGDWNNADVVEKTEGQAARILVGPEGGELILSPGQYNVWIKITDNPEVPVRRVPTVLVVF